MHLFLKMNSLIDKAVKKMHSNYKKVKKAIGGDQEALLFLINLEKEKLYRTAYSYVKNEADALDIFQKTVLLAIESIHQLREPKFFSTWLMRICINTSLRVLKEQKKVILMNEPNHNSFSIDTEISVEKLDLLDAIYRLDEKYKTIIILRYYEDLTFQQIAELLNEPLGTVKSKGKRALLKIKHLLKGVYLDERAK